MVSSKKWEIIKELQALGLPVVTIALLKKITGLSHSQSLASFVDSLVNLKVLEPAEKGKYLVKDNLGNDFLMANILYDPSYVSMETALNLYGILPQFPMSIISITTNRKVVKEIVNKQFEYYQLSKQWFWGYQNFEGALIALPEKALLDALYFSYKGIKDFSIEDLDLKQIHKDTFIQFSQQWEYTQSWKTKLKAVLKRL